MPINSFTAVAPPVSSAGMIAAAPLFIASSGRSGANGMAVEIVTSAGPVASMAVMLDLASWPRGEMLLQRRNDATTSAGVIGLPLWKMIPCRNGITIFVPPSDMVGSAAASSGATCQEPSKV